MTYNKILRIDVMIDLNYDIAQQQEAIKTVIKEIAKIRGVIMTKNDHIIEHEQFFSKQEKEKCKVRDNYYRIKGKNEFSLSRKNEVKK
tara:strand:+ start:406 stop:669 length:264 start_codon:yes stop_codon:yes gene_type:complete